MYRGAVNGAKGVGDFQDATTHVLRSMPQCLPALPESVRSPAAAPAEAAAPAAPAPAVVPGAIDAPPAGMGQVVFFRPSKFAGAAVSYKVRTGEGLQTVVGNMTNGVYFTFQGAPGSYQFDDE